MASMSSCGVAPWRNAALVCPLMQYGHCVTCATATAMTCLVFAGSAPSAKTRWLKASNTASMSGARAHRFCESSREAGGYNVPVGGRCRKNGGQTGKSTAVFSRGTTEPLDATRPAADRRARRAQLTEAVIIPVAGQGTPFRMNAPFSFANAATSSNICTRVISALVTSQAPSLSAHKGSRSSLAHSTELRMCL
jgi:hypothetical protein